jgi:flagella synthesis protein FlgN
MSGQSIVDALLPLLREERDGYRAFLDLLKEERAALEGRDPDALLAIAQRKSAEVMRLGRLGEARNQALRAHTGATDLAGIEAWCRKLDGATGRTVLTLWQELLDAARAARTLNEENGALITVRLKHNQQALAILRGAAPSLPPFYGPDGQPCGASSGRPLGKA